MVVATMRQKATGSGRTAPLGAISNGHGTDTDFHGHGVENQKARNLLKLRANLVAGACNQRYLHFDWAPLGSQQNVGLT
jgi:hypothetical protein